MRSLLPLLLFATVNGVTATAELNTRRAADGRHQPFIMNFSLPAEHIAWPEGTIMVAGDGAGSAKAAAPTDTELLGVLDTRVGANEQSGNVIIHGSVPADILRCEDDGELADAASEQIVALRGIGVYA